MPAANAGAVSPTAVTVVPLTAPKLASLSFGWAGVTGPPAKNENHGPEQSAGNNDEADQHPSTFWTYVVTGLRAATGGAVGIVALDLLRSPRPPIEAALVSLANELDALPRELAGQPLRHVLEVRHPSFQCAPYLALVRAHGVPTVFTDSPAYPSLADLSGDFRYARLMRSADEIPTGYAADALDRWAAQARDWAAGKDIDALPHVAPLQPQGEAREVFVFFISSAKHRNPAAAMALQSRVDAPR